jgi:hypothetical protein
VKNDCVFCGYEEAIQKGETTVLHLVMSQLYGMGLEGHALPMCETCEHNVVLAREDVRRADDEARMGVLDAAEAVLRAFGDEYEGRLAPLRETLTKAGRPQG